MSKALSILIESAFLFEKDSSKRLTYLFMYCIINLSNKTKQTKNKKQGELKMMENLIIQQLIAKVTGKVKKINKRKLKRNLKRTVAIVATLSIIFIVGKNVVQHLNVSGQEFNAGTAYAMNVPDKYKVVTIEVVGGTTAWEIQSTLVPQKEMNEALKTITKLNQRNMNDIGQGEELMFLTMNFDQK